MEEKCSKPWNALGVCSPGLGSFGRDFSKRWNAFCRCFPGVGSFWVEIFEATVYRGCLPHVVLLHVVHSHLVLLHLVQIAYVLILRLMGKRDYVYRGLRVVGLCVNGLSV